DDFDWNDGEDSDDEDEQIEEAEELIRESVEEVKDTINEIEEKIEDAVTDHEDRLRDKYDELTDTEDELVDETDDLIDEDDDLSQEEIRVSVEKVRNEIEEIRRMKETLRAEIDDMRRQKDDFRTSRRRTREPRAPRTVRPVKPVKSPKPPKAPKLIDLRPLTDSLEDMMEGLGEQIETSLRGIEGLGTDIRVPQFHVKRRGRKSRRKSKGVQTLHIEDLPPERVARVISPLGSEERLKILDYLRDGGKSFNDLESYTEKTGSSLTHHLAPLIEAGYVIKGEVRGTYYLTVEGTLAYRLAQWLTSRVEAERIGNGQKMARATAVKSSDALNDEKKEATVTVTIDDDDEDEED
ncbi:MAG: ArsR/SmtB family transcription factor, partial [Candidatus Thorarchaeota archaeon]